MLMKRITKILGIIIGAVLISSNIVLAQTKNTIEFKTSIVDQTGRPISDGNYNFRFALYDQSSGGTSLWSEERLVPIRKGGVSVDLGAFVPFNPSIFRNGNLYLQICFDANSGSGDGVGECAGRFEERFSPRKVVSGVPWAFRSENLGPKTISTGETAYNVETFGSDGTLFNLSFNDQSKFRVDSNGNVGLSEVSDIFIGSQSIRNSASAETSGAGLIGTYTEGLENITGNNLQEVLQNIDPLFRWKANGNNTYYDAGNVGIGTNNPVFGLDVTGIGNFGEGVIVGNTTQTNTGAIRFNGTTFEGYNGTTWVLMSGGSAAAAGANGQIQFNNGGSFGADPNLYWDDTNNFLGLGVTPARTLDVNGALRMRTIATPVGPQSGDMYSNGTNLFYYNGTVWVSMTNDATTDGGLGTTYVTNTANAFGVGGTTSTSPYFFDPSAGGWASFLRPANIGDGTGFSPTTNLMRIAATGAYTIAGGNNSVLRLNAAYNPTGGTGTEVFHGLDITQTINAGDGSTISRGRAVRATTINNSSGTVNGILPFSGISTNNGTVGTQWGLSTATTNNGTVNTTAFGVFADVTNNGTITQYIRAIELDTFNNGTVDSMYGGAIFVNNNPTGVVTGQQYAFAATSDNFGATGFFYGLRGEATNNAGSTSGQFGGALIQGLNQGGDTGLDPMFGIRLVAENSSGGSTQHMTGIDLLSDNSATVADSLIGIRNVVSNSGSVTNNVVGILSSDGVTTAALNWNGLYSFYTDQVARMGGGIVLGGNLGTEAGTIRWTGSDFEGYDGGGWVSFTAGGGGSSQWQDDGPDIYFSTGRVGIANSDPQFELDLGGSMRTSGTVGIGMDPGFTYYLDVFGAARFGNEIVVGNNSALAAGSIRFDGTDFAGYDGSTWITFGGGGSSAWLDDGFGNVYFDTGMVGIGTNSPGATLDVVGGSVNFGSLSNFYAGSSNTRFDGNFGINTDPVIALDVFGDTSINGNFTHTNGVFETNGDVGINTSPLYDFDVLGNSNFSGDFTVSSGITTFNNDVFIPNSALCVSDGTACPALAAGGVYARLAYEMFDVAENILADSDIEPGDIVAVRENQNEVVRKAVGGEDRMIGAISTDPGIMGGYSIQARDGFKPAPIALAGRIPVKVTTENGVINAGDPITSSSVPGVGMKASSTGKIIGYALESYSQGNGAIGKIVVFIQPTYVAFGTQAVTTAVDPAYITNIVNTVFQSRMTNGTSEIVAGNMEIVINDGSVTEGSVIMITPVGSTGGKVLYVDGQINGQFKVVIDDVNPAANTIRFKYLVVN